MVFRLLLDEVQNGVQQKEAEAVGVGDTGQVAVEVEQAVAKVAVMTQLGAVMVGLGSMDI